MRSSSGPAALPPLANQQRSGYAGIAPARATRTSLEDFAHDEKGNVGFGNRWAVLHFWCSAQFLGRRGFTSTAAALTPLRLRFPYDHAARKDFKHWCKDQWKLQEVAQIQFKLFLSLDFMCSCASQPQHLLLQIELRAGLYE